MIDTMQKKLKYLIGSTKDCIYRMIVALVNLHKKKRELPRESFGVIMNDEQYAKISKMMMTVSEETERREVAVKESLEELKKLEMVKTYTAYVRDMTMSIQSLSQVKGAERAVDTLVSSLQLTTDNFNQYGVLPYAKERGNFLQEKEPREENL